MLAAVVMESIAFALHAYLKRFPLSPLWSVDNTAAGHGASSGPPDAEHNRMMSYLFSSSLLLLLLLSESLLCPLPLHGSITSFSSVCKYHLTVQLVHGIQPGPVFVVPHKVGVVAILELIVRFALLPHVALPDGLMAKGDPYHMRFVWREGAM